MTADGCNEVRPGRGWSGVFLLGEIQCAGPVRCGPFSTASEAGRPDGVTSKWPGPCGSSWEDLALTTITAVSAKSRNGKASAKTTSAIKASDATIYRLTEVFKLLADKSRLKVLLALAQ